MPARDTQPSERIPIGDVARMLGISVDTVRRWEAEGRLSAVRTLGGQRRFLRSEVEALLDPQDAA